MDIDKKIKEKKELFEKKVEKYNTIHSQQNELKQELIKLQGSIEQLQELKDED